VVIRGAQFDRLVNLLRITSAFPWQRAGRGERECPRFPSRVALRAKPWVGERSSAGYP